jgi:5'-nucleotidase
MNASAVPELEQIVKRSTILRGELGLVGFITNTTSKIANSGNVTFEDPAVGVQRAVDDLREKGIRRIVAVSHNGYLEDIDVARRTKGIDLIVGGHSHTLLSKNLSDQGVGGYYPTKVTNLEGKATYIVQAKAWGMYVGVLDLEYDVDDNLISADGVPVLLDDRIPKQKKMEDTVQAWAEKFARFTTTVIGTAAVSFSAECSKAECPIANLITDAGRNVRPSFHAVLQHSGGIRSSLSQGNITVADILNMMPFGDPLMAASYTGTQLRAAFENVFAFKNLKGDQVVSLLHASGMKVAADRSKPAHQRITRFDICDSPECSSYEPVKDDKVYSIGIPGFVMNGGDNIFESKPASQEIVDSLDAIVMEYIKSKKTVSPFMDERLVILN